MSEMEDYLGRVRAVLMSLQGVVSAEGLAEADHLIDHGEPAEGLQTLAWVIVDEDKRVPIATLSAIRELAAGLVDESHWPPNLDEHAI